MTAEMRTMTVAWPPVKMGWWTTVGSGAVVNQEGDSSYLRAWQPPWQEDWHWSTWFGSGGIHEFQANVTGGSSRDPILRVRIRARARIEAGTYFEPSHMRGRLFWQSRLGDQVQWSGKSVDTTFDGEPNYAWHDIETPWMTRDPQGRPWTFRSLRRSRFLMGRTHTYGRMWVSRVWFEVEVPVPAPPDKPDMELTGPVGPIRHTSRPDVTWAQSGDFTQAGWEVEVHQGQRSSRALHTLVTGSGGHSDSRNRWTIDTRLAPQGIYTVFGRVARDWGGQLLWSDWESRSFDMDIAPPAPIPIVAEADNDRLETFVRWSSAEVGGFGLGPFGLTPFGGAAGQVVIESADNVDGPWIERAMVDVREEVWVDRFAPFNIDRWFRSRTIRESEWGDLASVPSDPVSARIEVDAPGTAAMTCCTSERAVLVQLRGKPLVPSLQNRMRTMGAADLGTMVAQGQPPLEHYEATFRVDPDEFDVLRRMLANPSVIVWRDAFRYRFPFVWSADVTLDPLVGVAHTPHMVTVRMTAVPWPEGVH